MSISNSELQLKLESMEEQLTRQKQVLREATAKHQNLIRHLKLIEAESGRLMYDETTSVTQVHSMEDLQRLVDLVVAWTPLVYRARPFLALVLRTPGRITNTPQANVEMAVI